MRPHKSRCLTAGHDTDGHTRSVQACCAAPLSPARHADVMHAEVRVGLRVGILVAAPFSPAHVDDAGPARRLLLVLQLGRGPLDGLSRRVRDERRVEEVGPRLHTTEQGGWGVGERVEGVRVEDQAGGGGRGLTSGVRGGGKRLGRVEAGGPRAFMIAIICTRRKCDAEPAKPHSDALRHAQHSTVNTPPTQTKRTSVQSKAHLV
eukprot:4183084-Prymnesium_polylepis.1